MHILVCNRMDPASCNIRDRLLGAGGWDAAAGGEGFRGHPVLRRGDAALVEVAGPVVTDEALSGDLGATGWPIEAVWFLSKHRAASGQASLTVHPIGNHGAAEFGGRAATLCPSLPRDMAALLRRLRYHRDAAGLPHQVTYEATHHGPLMTHPSLFVEIGSDEAWYGDVASGAAVAAAIHDVLLGGGARGVPSDDGRDDATDDGRDEGTDDGLDDGPDDGPPVAVGVGGGHYVPRMTDKALAAEMEFGHFLPAYAVDADEDDPGVLARAVAATPGCEGVYLHKKGLRGPQRQRVKAWCEAIGAALLD